MTKNRMTRESMEQLRHLPGEIEQIQRDIDSLPIVGDTVKDYRTGYAHRITIYGYDERQAGKLRKRLEQKARQLQEQLDELERWLDRVRDSELRRMLRMRYEDGLPWKDVARTLGYADESVPRKRIDRFWQMTDKSER